MLVITGVVDDKYTVLDDEDGVDEFATIEELYLYKAIGIYVEGCHFTKDGLVVDIDGRFCPRGTVDVPEVWRPVVSELNIVAVDGEWRYEVSNFGRVRVRDFGGKAGNIVVLTQRKDRYGYPIVNLLTNRGGKRRGIPTSVHRIVALTFIENRNGLETVNHLDEDKDNNRVDNLEWLTREENVVYGTRNYRLAVARTRAVRRYSSVGRFIEEYESAFEASKVFGVNQQAIWACCRRAVSMQTCRGFIWRYVGDDWDILDGSFARMLHGGLCDDVRPSSRHKVVRAYDADRVFVAEFYSVTGASVCLGVSSPSISASCRRSVERASRLVWRYEDDDELISLVGNRELLEEFQRKKGLCGSVDVCYRSQG